MMDESWIRGPPCGGADRRGDLSNSNGEWEHCAFPVSKPGMADRDLILRSSVAIVHGWETTANEGLKANDERPKNRMALTPRCLSSSQ